jgi:two-component system response regulator VicR
MGLELGADDYIVKPFKNRELIARAKTNIRRSAVLENPEPTELIKAGSIWVDTGKMLVTKKGEPVELTQREYELIKFLALSVGKVYTREELMSGVWNYDFYGNPRAVDVTIRRLRSSWRTSR